jgi:gas vesicle protein
MELAITFIAGLLTGGTVGAIAMALVAASSRR